MLRIGIACRRDRVFGRDRASVPPKGLLDSCYLKANAAEVLQELTEQRRPLVITQNGEAKAVLQDVASYEEIQETLALLKILALGNQQVEVGKVTRVEDAVQRLRTRKRAG